MLHVRHDPSPLGRDFTACGQLWQQWQAPEVYRDGTRGVLPGPAEEPDGDPFDCPVCAEALERWEAEAPLRERAAEAERVRARATAEVAHARRR